MSGCGLSNSRLIYCAPTGYGESGPLKDKAGYDQVLQAMTGICTFQGEAAGAPEIVYGSVVDYYAGSLLASGILAALFHRERTGEGQSIGISLLAASLTMQSARFIWADSEGREAGRDMRSGGVTGIHPTGHGAIYLSANTPHFWRALCEIVGLPELADHPDFDTVRKRARRAAEIVPKIHDALAKRSALEWEDLFGDSVPCAAVRPIEDMFDHPQTLAEGLVTTFDHPAAGRYRGVRKPVKFSATPGPEPFAAPALGQHNAEILASLGYSTEEIERLAGGARSHRASGAEETRLATYGSLSPGQANHHQLAGLKGRWYQGTVHGRRIEAGWGSALGFPGLILDPSGPAVEVYIFESSDLLRSLVTPRRGLKAPNIGVRGHPRAYLGWRSARLHLCGCCLTSRRELRSSHAEPSEFLGHPTEIVEHYGRA